MTLVDKPRVILEWDRPSGMLSTDVYYLWKDGVLTTSDITTERVVYDDPGDWDETHQFSVSAGLLPNRNGPRSAVLEVVYTRPSTTLQQAELYVYAGVAVDAPLEVSARFAPGVALTTLGQFTSTDALYPAFTWKSFDITAYVLGQAALDNAQIRITRLGGAVAGYSDPRSCFIKLTMADDAVIYIRPNEDVVTPTMELLGAATGWQALRDIVTEAQEAWMEPYASASASGQFVEVGFETTLITIGDTTAPLAPAKPELTDLGTTSFTVTWVANAEPDVAGYRVERNVSGGAFSVVAGSPTLLTDRTYSASGLTAGLTYGVRIIAVDYSDNASLPGQVEYVTPTTTPGAPQNVSIDSSTPRQPVVGWDVVSGANSYRVHRDGELVVDGYTAAPVGGRIYFADSHAPLGPHSWTVESGTYPNVSTPSTAALGTSYGINVSVTSIDMAAVVGGDAVTLQIQLTGIGNWSISENIPNFGAVPSSGSLASLSSLQMVTVTFDPTGLSAQVMTGVMDINEEVLPYIIAVEVSLSSQANFIGVGEVNLAPISAVPVTFDASSDFSGSGSLISLALSRYARVFDGDDRIVLPSGGSVAGEPMWMGAAVYLTGSANRLHFIVGMASAASTSGRGLAVNPANGMAMWHDLEWGFYGPNSAQGYQDFPLNEWVWIVGRASTLSGNLFGISWRRFAYGSTWLHYETNRSTRGAVDSHAWVIGAGHPNDVTSTWIGRIIGGFVVIGSYPSTETIESTMTDNGSKLFVQRSVIEGLSGVDHSWPLTQSTVSNIPDTVGTADQSVAAVGTTVYDAGSAILPWAD